MSNATIINITDSIHQQTIHAIQNMQQKSIIEKIQWITGINNIHDAQRTVKEQIVATKQSIKNITILMGVIVGIAVISVPTLTFLPTVLPTLFVFAVYVLALLWLYFFPLQKDKEKLKQLQTLGIYALISETTHTPSELERFDTFKRCINNGFPIDSADNDIAFDELLFMRTTLTDLTKVEKS